MRNILSTILLLSLGACAARPAPHTTVPTVAYACDNSLQLAHEGKHLDVASRDTASTPPAVQLGWVDDAGEHYVQWAVSPTQASSVEFVIPKDPHADAIARNYDTSQGSSRADWRLVNESTCAVHGGYTDALTRFAEGYSMDDIKSQLSLSDKAEARALVHDAMIKLQRRYYGDR